MLMGCYATFPIATSIKNTWVTNGLVVLAVNLTIRAVAVIMALVVMTAYLQIDVLYFNEESVMNELLPKERAFKLVLPNEYN